MSPLCTWCGTEHEPRDGAGFCSEGCRQDFDVACRIWAAQEYEAERVSIFELRTCLGQHTRSPGHDSGAEGKASSPRAQTDSGGSVADEVKVTWT